MEPRSDVRLTRTKPRFVRGVVIGDTDLTATELTNIETVANLDAEDLEALASSADALTAIGTYAGAADIATDLAGVVSTVGDASAGLVKDVADAAADIIDLQAAAVLEITEKPNPLAVTVPDNTPYVTVSITADDGTIELTLPTGASNVGRLLALSVDISGSTTLDVHTGVAEETSIPNGTYLYYCVGEGTWAGLHEIYAAYVAET